MSENYVELARFAGKMATGLLTGAMVYATLVHQPAIVDQDDKGAVESFCAMFKRAFPSQTGYSVVGIAANSYVYYVNREEKNYLYSAGLLFCILPWTKIVLMPVNNALMAIPDEVNNKSEEEKEEIYKKGKSLSHKWGNVHAVRSFLGIGALGLLLYKSK